MNRYEATERIKTRFDKWALDDEDMRAIQTLIPELKDSEDERIRKWIVEEMKIFHNQAKEFGVNEDIEMTTKAIAYLEKQKEQKPIMIQWTGKNLKEVIDFTGKSQKFSEWFKSWEDFENYVHTHNDIIKLFCEDGSHYEVPVGAWIVKTPDGYNIPSRFRFIQKPAEWSEEDERIRKNLISELVNLEVRGLIKVKTAEKYRLWLKSSRTPPHWKPSEAQMEWLESAVKLSTDKPHIHGIIVSLYEQLKRL